MDEALDILLTQGNRIPDYLQTFIGAQASWDGNLSSILEELGTDAKFYDDTRIPDECVIYNNQDGVLVDHLASLKRAKQNLTQNVNNSTHPFWLLEKEDGGGGVIVELKSKHPYTIGCLEVHQKSDEEAILKVVEEESSGGPGPRHIEGFLDTSQEMLKNQQVATNLIYSIGDEAIAQFRDLFQMDPRVFDKAGNGNMAVQLIQLLLSCQDTLNKTQAFLANTKDIVNNTLVSQSKSVCSTCLSPNHCNVYDLGVLVSLNQLKAQKETAKSLEQATKKVSSNSRQTSTTTTTATPRTHPLLDSVMMGLWMNPDQNHRKNSNAKTLVFTSASKDAHCYLKAAMVPLIAKENYNNSNKKRNSKTSTTTNTTSNNNNNNEMAKALLTASDQPIIGDEHQQDYGEEGKVDQKAAAAAAAAADVMNPVASTSSGYRADNIELVEPNNSESSEINQSLEKVDREIQALNPPSTPVPILSLTAADSDDEDDGDFTDFINNDQKGRRTSIISKYQIENKIQNSLTTSTQNLFDSIVL